jgi:PAS domain S-box-containing protein
MTLRYLLVLVGLGVLSVLAFLTLQLTIAAGQHDAATINISGRQRMLLRHTSVLVGQLAIEEDVLERAELKQQLVEAADSIERSHDGLLRGDAELNLDGNPSSKIQRLYFEPPLDLDARIRSFVAEARVVGRDPYSENPPDEHRLEAIKTTATALVAGVDELVRGYQQENEAFISRIQIFNAAGLGLTLATLLMAGVFVFHPMVLRVRKEMRGMKEAQAIVRKSEEQLRLLTDTAPVLISYVDSRQRLKFVNACHEGWFGEPVDRLTGMRLEDLVGGPAYDVIRPRVEAVLSGEGAVFEARIPAEDGERDVAISYVPHFSEDRKVLGFVAVVTDLSDLKHLQEQLLQAQKMESIGQLAGGIAHDINNQLTSIISLSELGARDLDSGHQTREYLRKIRLAGEKSAAITRQLLAFSRRQVLQPKIVDLNELLADLGKMLPSLIREDIETVFVPGENVERINVDPVQIEQVVINLATNARDAMPRGGRLTIQTKNVEIDECYANGHAGATLGPHVMLTVSDTGEGMDKATLSQVFEPFFTTKDAAKGTGLGLSMAHGIIKQSGGAIEVYSEPGQGTTFKIYLPVAAGEPGEKREQPESTEVRGGNETILMAEDEDLVRWTAKHVLEKHGYQVLDAADGDEAYQQCREHGGDIQLLITDMVMPGMNGQELARRAKELIPGIKILRTSGYPGKIAAEQGFLESEEAFLEKPFSIDSLVRKVREVLDESGGNWT